LEEDQAMDDLTTGPSEPPAGETPPPDGSEGRRAAREAPHVGDYFAHVRHELRTPVNAILGYSEMLQEEAEELGQQPFLDDLQRIHTAGRRLLTLIDDVRDPLAALGDGKAVRAGNGVVPPGEAPAGASREQGVRDVLSRPVATSPDSPVALPPSEVTGRLLVVDDNESNRDVLSRHLQRQGHTVTTAEDGHQALAMLQMEGFDLVLLDIMMPEVDGYQVLEQMKSDPALNHLPVLLLSARDDLESVVRGIAMGAEDYLPKPFNPVLLRARIGACLEKKQLRDQEIEYLQSVGEVTAAAAAIEAGDFAPETLMSVAARADELGQLARVFQEMTREIQARERRLKEQVQQLRVEVDQARRARQVAEITQTDYFQNLKQQARALRDRKS
jgi:DNA-binding response OmpR family regulator